MMKRGIFLCTVILCLLSMTAKASVNLQPLPDHDPTPVMSLEDQEFVVVYGTGAGTTKAYVDSIVYDADDDGLGYIYSYQIHDAAVKFTWFSVAFDPVDITGWGVVDASGTLPTAWDPVESSKAATNMEAFFSSGLTSSNSALLWFSCLRAPDVKIGSLTKLSVGGGTYAEGHVLSPVVPEPMTAILLGFGWLAVRSYRRKS